VLAIRLQALGDVVITLPYLQALRDLRPGVRLDLLTREETSEIPERVRCIDRVHVLGGGRSTRKQILRAIEMIPRLRREDYDVVLDLQRNRVSRLVRFLLRPVAYGEFDRFSPKPAGWRTAAAIESAGLGKLPPIRPLELENETEGLSLLADHGWCGSTLVVLNPAGAFPTRNWPLENYVTFARLWLERVADRTTKFLVLGLDKITARARFLESRLGAHLIDLTGKTSPPEALGIVRRARLVLSEDSALMHMAWTSGVPVVALFGASRGDWSAPPPGSRSICLHSGDLECGFCMKEACPFGHIECLTRHTPEKVLDAALDLLASEESSDVP